MTQFTYVCHVVVPKVVVDNTHPAKGGQSMSVFILLLVELWHLFLGHMMYVTGGGAALEKDFQTAFRKQSAAALLHQCWLLSNGSRTLWRCT